MCIAYWNYQATGLRISVIERQLEAYNDPDLPPAPDAFDPHHGPVRAQAELRMLPEYIFCQMLKIVLLLCKPLHDVL